MSFRQGRAGLEALPGIGASLAYTIEGLVRTGEFRTLRPEGGHIDPERLLTSLPGVGPQLAHLLRERLGITTLEELERAAHEGRLAEVGPPGEGEAASSPRQVVARALGYLGNNAKRMRYDAYRRQGLPITSSYVESAVKQFNARVKGTEKFWGEEGAEAILQLRADHLSEDQPLEAFWQRRQAAATGQRPYRRAG